MSDGQKAGYTQALVGRDNSVLHGKVLPVSCSKCGPGQECHRHTWERLTDTVIARDLRHFTAEEDILVRSLEIRKPDERERSESHCFKQPLQFYANQGLPSFCGLKMKCSPAGGAVWEVTGPF